MANYVNSRVTLNMPRIRALSAATVRALEKTAEAVHTDVVQAQVLPRDSGALTINTHCEFNHASRGTVSIISQTIYARRLYYHPEYNFSTAENSNARGKWFAPWIGGEKRDFAKKAFVRFYRMEAGL